MRMFGMKEKEKIKEEVPTAVDEIELTEAE